MDQTKQISNILKRLDRLEEAVFHTEAKSTSNNASQKFTGAKGGVLFLLSNNFFSKIRPATDVKDELAQNEYYYSIQVVQTTLNRLAKGNGPLTTMKVSGKKVYVKRK